MTSHAKPRPFTIDELRAYLLEIFPELWKRGDLRVEDLAPMAATLRLVHHPRHLRPGGTISGPAMFALCDVALYVAILGELGRVAHAVTTNVSINFLRKPAPADLIGKARLIKLGKRLAVGEVALYSEGESEMVAHATGTYSLPARGEAASWTPGTPTSLSPLSPPRKRGSRAAAFAILDARLRGHDRESICGILIPHHCD